MRVFKKFFWDEVSLRIHILFFLVVIYFANIFKISKTEWLVLIIMFVIVLLLEMLNLISKELGKLFEIDKKIEIIKIKEVSSASLFLASITLLVIISIIFIPYLKIF